MQKNRTLLSNMPSPEALTAMVLLIAENDPRQKSLIIKLIINLIEARPV
jgi:hypothetical protein